MLAVVRLTHGERALRAAYLMLRERAEDALAVELAARMGKPVTAIEVRVQAAAMSAVLKVATDDIARASAEGLTRGTLDRHREQIASALRGLALLL